MAPFPWPDVPAPTARRVLDRDLLHPVPATLGALVSQLKQQVKAAGYQPPPVLGAGCNGFALILEGERIWPDGERIDFVQWGQTASLKVGDILRKLLTAPPGLYRMIVVVVSTERPAPTPTVMSARTLSGLAAQGGSGLPKAMAALPFNADYEVRVLVYEFLKGDRAASQVAPNGRVPVDNHVQQAGLLPKAAR